MKTRFEVNRNYYVLEMAIGGVINSCGGTALQTNEKSLLYSFFGSRI